jgi:hypothetical protein
MPCRPGFVFGPAWNVRTNADFSPCRSVTSGSTSNNSDGGTTSSSSSGGSSSGNPVPPQNAADVDIDGTCSAFVACGGDPQGTFDYTGGCIEDVFAGARGACSGLDTTKAIVKVKGSITFNGNALLRDVTVTTSGQITLPQSCTYGQCAMIENNLKGAFDSVSCTGSTDCTCTICPSCRAASMHYA